MADLLLATVTLLFTFSDYSLMPTTFRIYRLTFRPEVTYHRLHSPALTCPSFTVLLLPFPSTILLLPFLFTLEDGILKDFETVASVFYKSDLYIKRISTTHIHTHIYVKG